MIYRIIKKQTKTKQSLLSGLQSEKLQHRSKRSSGLKTTFFKKEMDVLVEPRVSGAGKVRLELQDFGKFRDTLSQLLELEQDHL